MDIGPILAKISAEDVAKVLGGELITERVISKIKRY